MSDFDCVVVGAGPAGLAASLYLKRASLSVLLVDKESPGGKLLKIKNIENYMGFQSINGSDLALKMYSQVKALKIPFMLGKVNNIKGSIGKFQIEIDNKTITTSYVVIATGRSASKFELDNGKINGISYCAICDGTFYQNKKVGIYGSGKELIEDAIYLKTIASKVYIFNRETTKSNKDLNNIKIVENCKITSLDVKNSNLIGITLENGDRYKIDGLFITSSFGRGIPLNVDKIKGYIKVNSNMETSIKGIYACGDAIYKEFYQISTAINDGIISALSIKKGETYERN